MNENLVRPKPGGGFYLLWVLSGVASILLAWIFSWGIILILRAIFGDTVVINGVRHITEDYFFMWIFFPLVGLLQGGIQALVLREVRSRPGMWGLVTPVGWIVAFIVLRAVSDLFFPNGGMPVDTLLSRMLIIGSLGVCIGVAQWFVLRRWAARAGWWVLFSTLGWALLPVFSGTSFSSVLELLLIGFLPNVICVPGLWLLFDRGQGKQAEAVS